jgi:hypothetical protein
VAVAVAVKPAVRAAPQEGAAVRREEAAARQAEGVVVPAAAVRPEEAAARQEEGVVVVAAVRGR